ncbi:hypothetical protein [Rufibacter soli]
MTEQEIIEAIALIRNETEAGANSKIRIADLLEALLNLNRPERVQKDLVGLNPIWSTEEGQTANITAAGGNVNLIFSPHRVPMYAVLNITQQEGARTLMINGDAVSIDPAAGVCTSVGILTNGVVTKYYPDYSTANSNTGGGNTTPAAPTVTADDAANTLSASHALGTSEIVVSTNGGAYVAYAGTINVGDVARAAGYWKFKVKAATGRNESSVANSPAFTVAPAGNTTPAAPAFTAFDDTANTVTLVPASGVPMTDYRWYITAEGASQAQAVPANGVILVGNIEGNITAYSVASGTRNQSPNAVSGGFTTTTENPPAGGIEYSRYYSDYTMEDANITTTGTGADRVIVSINNKTATSTEFTDLVVDPSGTGPKVVANALNGYQGIEIRTGDKLQWNSGEAHFKPLTVVSVCILLEQRAYGYMQHCSTMAYGVNGLKPYMVGDNNTVLESSVGVQVGVPFVFLKEFNAGAPGTANGKLYVNEVKGADGPVGDADTNVTLQLYESSGLSAHYMLLEHRLLKVVLTEDEKQAVIEELMAKYAIS